jgi:hypothetical protein
MTAAVPECMRSSTLELAAPARARCRRPPRARVRSAPASATTRPVTPSARSPSSAWTGTADTPTDAGAKPSSSTRVMLATRAVAIADSRRPSEIGGAVRVGCVSHVELPRLQSFVGAQYAGDPSLELAVVHLGSARSSDASTRARWTSALSTMPTIGAGSSRRRWRHARADVAARESRRARRDRGRSPARATAVDARHAPRLARGPAAPAS